MDRYCKKCLLWGEIERPPGVAEPTRIGMCAHKANRDRLTGQSPFVTEWAACGYWMDKGIIPDVVSPPEASPRTTVVPRNGSNVSFLPITQDVIALSARRLADGEITESALLDGGMPASIVQQIVAVSKWVHA